MCDVERIEIQGGGRRIVYFDQYGEVFVKRGDEAFAGKICFREIGYPFSFLA